MDGFISIDGNSQSIPLDIHLICSAKGFPNTPECFFFFFVVAWDPLHFYPKRHVVGEIFFDCWDPSFEGKAPLIKVARSLIQNLLEVLLFLKIQLKLIGSSDSSFHVPDASSLHVLQERIHTSTILMEHPSNECKLKLLDEIRVVKSRDLYDLWFFKCRFSHIS